MHNVSNEKATQSSKDTSKPVVDISVTSNACLRCS